MNVVLTNFNPSSDSGPNSFSKGLFNSLLEDSKIRLVDSFEKADIEFSLIESLFPKTIPRITRLDGIYFNTSQDYNLLNTNIKKTYLESDSVVFQSEFNKDLITSWFGEHESSYVISNGANTHLIDKIEPADMKETFGDKEIWVCASSWRPHKRLRENIRYFIEKASDRSVLLVAGKGATKEDFLGYESLINNRIFYLGHLPWKSLISIYKTSSTFVHLAFLDHCPNVVVDAAACDCTIVCSSSGGTKEISSLEKVVIDDLDWDFSPLDLYSPPPLDFENYLKILCDKSYNLNNAAEMYFSAMEKLIEKS